jgi:hypothetical protein
VELCSYFPYLGASDFCDGDGFWRAVILACCAGLVRNGGRN